MKWRQANESRGAVLRRIAFMLVTMAMMAERAAAAPARLRRYVLSILRNAEWFALDYVSEFGFDITPLIADQCEFDPHEPGDDGGGSFDYCPADDVAGAMRLALTFRALASIIYMLSWNMPGNTVPRTGIFALVISSRMPNAAPHAGRLFRLSAPQPAYLDTS